MVPLTKAGASRTLAALTTIMYIVTTWIGHGWIGGACPGVWCGVLLLLALGFPTFPRKHGIDWGWCGPGGVEEAELEF
jgi:hypothetical protein